MKLLFENCAISGLLSVVPQNERNFVDEMANFNFPASRSLKLKQVMGYDRHRIVDGEVCVSDLVQAGLRHLFLQGLLVPDEIDALILITQTPDYPMPPTSNVIQGKLGLKTDLLCMDINQGCAGFLIGLMEAFLLLQQSNIGKVVVANADVLSRKVSPRDRNSYPLIGDAASIAIVERSPNSGPIPMCLKMDGARSSALCIPAGGMKNPSSPATAEMTEDQDGNFRCLDNLVMDGAAVFNFVQVEVPPMVEELLAQAGTTTEGIDAFFFHQPNRFMLQKLAQALRVPEEKMPMNVVEYFGNSSGVTIPVAIAHNFRDRLLRGSMRTCLAGFGVGLTWASMLLTLGPLQFCELIEFA